MGRVKGGAEVNILNKNTDQIVGEITDSTGRYDLEMEAQIGDWLAVRQRIGTNQSPPTEVLVTEEGSLGEDGPIPSPPIGAAGSPAD